MHQPFLVHVEEKVINDLKKRIQQTRWPVGKSPNGWQNGVSISYLKDLVDYWLTGFDWYSIEKKINGYPNFIADIQGHHIHYLHVKGTSKNSIPLIITHGWPGSFIEMLKIIPLLTKNDDITFNLVIPSLLGFGFSEKPSKKGANSKLMSTLWVKLMKELGYDRFMVQGGDFGADVSTQLALHYPDNVIAVHLNYIPFDFAPFLKPGEQLTREETDAEKKAQAFFQAEGSYAQQHISKPLTLSYALADSPVGLCAWIVQLFHSFSDRSKELDDLFDRDDLLANVTLYWVTETIYSSIKLYSEILTSPLKFGETDFVNPPVGIAHYPFPDGFAARRFIERGYNVQYWKDLPKGGHFAAMEQPELFAKDLQEFARSLSASGLSFLAET
jgi:pimeloyl-ACP methyl ester carboxylesterase